MTHNDNIDDRIDSLGALLVPPAPAPTARGTATPEPDIVRRCRLGLALGSEQRCEMFSGWDPAHGPSETRCIVLGRRTLKREGLRPAFAARRAREARRLRRRWARLVRPVPLADLATALQAALALVDEIEQAMYAVLGIPADLLRDERRN